MSEGGQGARVEVEKEVEKERRDSEGKRGSA
jgi:hypothetical protein